jgi:sugar/nucleoside kinase (ribokinase family)
MRFIIGGGLRLDYLITPQGEAYIGLPGGNALYAAVGAAIWTQPVELWARLGQNYPQRWLEGLPAQRLGTAGLVRIPGKQDHRTFYAYTPDGRREDIQPAAHFSRINQPLPAALQGYVHSTPGQDDPHQYEPLALRPADWPATWTAAPDSSTTALHLSPLCIRTHLHVPPFVRQHGVSQITVDPGERYMIPARLSLIRQILPHVDAFLPSDQEVQSLFGAHVDLWQAAETLCQWGAPLVVIKNGPNGALLLQGAGGRRTQLPAYHRPGDSRIVDVTGAGDAFCGGFMVGLAQSGDPLAAARQGLVSASYVIEGYGALYALGHCATKERRLASLSG